MQMTPELRALLLKAYEAGTQYDEFEEFLERLEPGEVLSGVAAVADEPDEYPYRLGDATAAKVEMGTILAIHGRPMVVASLEMGPTRASIDLEDVAVWRGSGSWRVS